MMTSTINSIRAVGRIVASATLFATALAVPRVAHTQAAAQRAAAFDPTEKSITELQEAMAAGRTSSADLTNSYLARILAYDHAGPALNTMIRLNPLARADAAAMDAERRAGTVRGPMHGIPIILKDNYDTKGLGTSAGSLALASHVPAADAFIVRKLREAGAVILGKSNLHELASGITTISSLGGQTLNPYDPARCPGGSSGGTGAAVAASFGAIGWGTDTCGSIRIPSAFGSLFGLRPTTGLFSLDGIIPLSLTQDVPGPLARTVTDLAIGLDVTVGPDPADPATQVMEGRPLPQFGDALQRDALRGARIGIFRPYFRGGQRDVNDTVRAAARSMAALGAEVIEVDMPDFDSVIGGTRAILLETRFDLIDYFGRAGGAPVNSLTEIVTGGFFDKSLEERHKGADTISARDSEEHREVLARQARLRARIVALMDSLNLDALAYPTIPERPVLVGAAQTTSSCALAAQAGLPAISMPAGFTSDGLPTGLELLGRPFADARLVGFAYAYEQAMPRRRPPPTTPALVNGRVPPPVGFSMTVGPTESAAIVGFTFTPSTSELAYSVRRAGTNAAAVTAVVIRRADVSRDASGRATEPAAGARSRVIMRVLGPDMLAASGKLRLLGEELEAYRAGALSVAVFTSASAAPIAEVPILSPR
ncbi:MAG: amidase family protein [Gemmatimonadetes bacterium]|nr:amidase family protein [Gemmatimonadota bacterium]